MAPPTRSPMRARRGLDTGRVAAAASRHGIDPRVWVEEALVLAIARDPERGVYADLETAPSGIFLTLPVAEAYVAAGGGFSTPMAVGDRVVVVVCSEPERGGAILGRLREAYQPLPPATRQGTDDAAPSQDIVAQAADGVHVRVRAKGGGTVHVTVEGDGDVVIEQTGTGDVILSTAADAYKVKVGGASGTQPIALGQVLKEHLDAVNTYLGNHIHGIATQPVTGTPPTVSGVTAGPTTPPPDVPDVRAKRGEVR